MATETETFLAQLVAQLSPSIQSMVQGSCAAILGQTSTNLPAIPGSTFPSPVSGCPYPASPASPMIQGCGPVCDPCAFPQVALDLSLYSFPQIEAELWDQQTSINVLDVGAFPLAPGGTLTLSQEARRTLSWIPGVVSIASTWSGGDPQPGLLTYQWASASKGAGPAGVQFGAPMNGQQFECGTNCLNVPFPRYRGCDGVMIGSLSKLQLIVTLSAAATSTLESLMVTVYHKMNKPAKSAGSCGC